MKKLMAVLILVVILAAMVMTNPSAGSHRDEVRQTFNAALRGAMSESVDADDDSANVGMWLVSQLADAFINKTLDTDLEYHNYIIMSTSTYEFNNEPKTVTVGLLGKVFPLVSKQKVEEQIMELFNSEID